ncbi:hypothetical protein ACFQS7_23175 [Dankookia sp. GCM10030260]|uniref:hypothetical protein n=1 Tax=Dankookia sp. GCM10030260 TaxID=3273390 RepID=UPI003616DAF6
MPDLAAALSALAACLPLAEPPAAALAAEAWRQAFRPPRIRLLLLAESHMATGAAELACPIRLPPGLDWPLPAGFVRHLYCPAYGEPALVPGLPAGNAGTPQYWRLFAALDGRPAPTRAACPDPARRLAAKAALLRRLRARGIWLTDASLVAVAGPGGAREAARIHADAVRLSWDRYHAAILPALAPDHVVVIGRAVAAVLRGALDAAFPGRWQAVPQPMGARRPGEAAALLATLATAARRYAAD